MRRAEPCARLRRRRRRREFAGRFDREKVRAAAPSPHRRRGWCGAVEAFLSRCTRASQHAVTSPPVAGHLPVPGHYSLPLLTMDVLSPFIAILCHSDWLFHGESCPRLDVVHPGRAWPSSPALFLALSVYPGNSLVSSWCDHASVALAGRLSVDDVITFFVLVLPPIGPTSSDSDISLLIWSRVSESAT